MTRKFHVGVVGGGAWGSALAAVARAAGNDVLVWQRAAGAPPANGDRRLGRTHDLAALAGADLLLLAVPAQALRAVAARLPAGTATLVICAKGLERPGGHRLSLVLGEVLPGRTIAVLSGPSFAAEVARGLPTAVTVAASDLGRAQAICGQLRTASFRPYPSADLVGVEIGGALKNVIAIAAGIAQGRGLGENARAALIARGLAELSRLGLRLGARRETLMGLSGLGDLVLSAASPTSRNMRFGLELGQGRSPTELLAAGQALAEGAWTASAALALAAAHGVELPLTGAVAAVIEGRQGVDEALAALLARPLPEQE